MTQSYEQVLDLVINKLEKITVNNGYHSDVTVLNGWLTFYAKDLAKGIGGRTFPAVAVHYDRDVYKVNVGAIDATVDRTLKLTGAVSTDDYMKVNKLLDELLMDVKIAIGTNRKLTMVGCEFMLPEGNDPYAMFDMTLVLNVNEKWEL